MLEQAGTQNVGDEVDGAHEGVEIPQAHNQQQQQRNGTGDGGGDDGLQKDGDERRYYGHIVVG